MKWCAGHQLATEVTVCSCSCHLHAVLRMQKSTHLN